MDHIPSLTRGFCLAAVLIVAIGAQNAFVLRQGLRREHVGPIIAFCVLADIVLMSAGVAGLGALVAGEPGLIRVFAILGAAYIGAQGIGALRRALNPEAALVAATGSAPKSRGAALLGVAALTLLNPHVYLDTVILAGGIGAAEPEGGQLPFLLGAGLASLIWFSALGYGARLLTPVFARPAAWQMLDAGTGAMFVLLASGLVGLAIRGA